MSLRRGINKKRMNKVKENNIVEEKSEKSEDQEEEEQEEDDSVIEETFNISENLIKKEVQDNDLNKNKDMGDYIIENSYIFINSVLMYLYYAIKISLKVSGVYFMWIILHYGASHLYIQFCVPKTPWGFLISPFLTATPHCQGLRWIVYNAANVINNMWVILGAWICSTILLINRDNADQNI